MKILFLAVYLATKMSEIEELRARVAQLEYIIELQRKRIDELELLLKLKISEKKVPAFVKPDLHHENKPPGQKQGHEGKTRPLPEKFDEEKTLPLKKCPDCGSKLSAPVETREHVVEDIIPARAIAKKYLIPRYWCGGCKKIVEQKPTDVFPNYRFGMNLCVLIMLLRMIALPVNKIQRMLDVLFNLKMSSATVENILYRCADEFDGRYDEILGEIRDAGNVNADETGSRVDGENWWLWVFVTKAAALYKIEHSRGKKVVEDTLGEKFAGVLSSDSYNAYESLECRKQKCLVHYLREIKKWEEKFTKEGEFAKFSRKAKRILKGAVRAHKKLKTKAGRLRVKQRLEAQFEKIYSKKYKNPEINRICKNFKRHAKENFTFLEVDGVEPTNNEAERAIRPYVVMRKISGCHRSERGAAAHQRLLSVYRTSQLQGQNFMGYAMDYFAGRLAGTSES